MDTGRDKDWMMIEIPSRLQDRWERGQAPGATLKNPATGEAVARTGSGFSLGPALAHLRSTGGPSIRALPLPARAELLQALARALHGARDALIEASVRNTGVTRSDAKFDVDGGIATLQAYVEVARSLGTRRFLVDGPGIPLGRSPRFHGVHVQVPLRGVAVHINAFNFPVWGLAEKLACAFAAGMPVLSKPATATALPAYLAAKALVDSGALPAGSFAFLAGGVQDLLDHLGPADVVAFTGSAATGRTIRTHPGIVARGVRVNIEADSLNAAVVGPDVKPGTDTWDLLLRETAREITQKSGQKCTATRRLLVPRARMEDLISGLAERLAEVRAGDPGTEGVRMGTLATHTQALDVLQSLRRLAAACPVAIGSLPSEPTTLLDPVVLRCDDPDATPEVHEIEVFGPVATLLAYDGTASHAGSLVARGEGSLVTTVYSDDPAFTEAAFAELAPWTGRILFGNGKIAEHSTGPGLVLPGLVHGGPGRAGGGLELGGVRGLGLYMQTCAVQGYRPALERLLELPPA
jgi:3,4-dehydroadipyl-CoA semialdehyde dehydrogenase